MQITYKDPLSQVKVGTFTPKQIKILFHSRPVPYTPEVRKMFNGEFNRVSIAYNYDESVSFTFKKDQDPGFLLKNFSFDHVKLVQNDWINSPILNRSGLASLLWDDNIPNKLRRRLEQRVQYATFTQDEKKKITVEVERFAKQVIDSLNFS